jgi:SAM-dependent methyltransferase
MRYELPKQTRGRVVTSSYEERVRSQIEQYASVEIHALPEIAHVWSAGFIGPGMSEVFGTISLEEFYVNAYTEAKGSSIGTGRILSIGCGDGATEVGMIEALLNRRQNDFVIVCSDISPVLLERLMQKVRAKGYERWVQVNQADFNIDPFSGEFDMIMAHHSLHHIVNLEQLFTYCWDHLKNRGIFATNDMIGRNGHLRWPETAVLLKALWPTLTDAEKWNAALKRLDDGFIDHDCSTEGFEGIRAQEILPLLLKKFHPYRFHAFGGFIDPLVDRGYGHAYDPKRPEHVAKIRFLATLNDVLLDAGAIKPTIMMAYFTKTAFGWPEVFYRNRRAQDCVRTAPPEWVKWHSGA